MVNTSTVHIYRSCSSLPVRRRLVRGLVLFLLWAVWLVAAPPGVHAAAQAPTPTTTLSSVVCTDPAFYPKTLLDLELAQGFSELDLVWNLASLDNLKTFYIQRSEDGLNFARLKNPDGTDVSVPPADDNYADTNVLDGKPYWYKVEIEQTTGGANIVCVPYPPCLIEGSDDLCPVVAAGSPAPTTQAGIPTATITSPLATPTPVLPKITPLPTVTPALPSPTFVRPTPLPTRAIPTVTPIIVPGPQPFNTLPPAYPGQGQGQSGGPLPVVPTILPRVTSVPLSGKVQAPTITPVRVTAVSPGVLHPTASPKPPVTQTTKPKATRQNGGFTTTISSQGNDQETVAPGPGTGYIFVGLSLLGLLLWLWGGYTAWTWWHAAI